MPTRASSLPVDLKGVQAEELRPQEAIRLSRHLFGHLLHSLLIARHGYSGRSTGRETRQRLPPVHQAAAHTAVLRKHVHQLAHVASLML